MIRPLLLILAALVFVGRFTVHGYGFPEFTWEISFQAIAHCVFGVLIGLSLVRWKYRTSAWLWLAILGTQEVLMFLPHAFK